MTGRRITTWSLLGLGAVVAFWTSSTLAHPVRHITPPASPVPRLTERAVASNAGAAQVAELPRLSLPAAHKPPVKPKASAPTPSEDGTTTTPSGAGATPNTDTGSTKPNTGSTKPDTGNKKTTQPKFQTKVTEGEFE